MAQHFEITGWDIAHTNAPGIQGAIEICGAKNAVLPVFFSAIHGNAPLRLHNVPNLSDVDVTLEIFKHLGASVEFANGTVTLNAASINRQDIPYDLASKMRASIWAAGPLLAKYGKCSVALPGGCAIGARPVDLHIKALEQLGASIEIDAGNLVAVAPEGGLVGAKIAFPFVSVGATVTAVSAAVLAKGVTIIDNAAREPEVEDVCNFLNALGADIRNVGHARLEIHGVESLGQQAVDYCVIADRIETATYLIGGMISRSKVQCRGTTPLHLESVLEKLTEAGAKLTYSTRDGKELTLDEVFKDKLNDVTITCDMEGRRPLPVNIITQPYPGIPTDVQAQFTLLNTVADGTSTICETIFENRFMHVPELVRMGAKITQKGNTIHITGVESLSGARVKATDLRASISLVLAGCIAKGQTIVDEIYHIDRGYEAIEDRLQSLNCQIVRKNS